MIAEAFRLLQAGRALEALEVSRQLVETQPESARAHLAHGLALRLLGRGEESLGALQRAASLDPRDYAAAYELGIALQTAARAAEAFEWLARAGELRPAFAPAHFAAGMNAFGRGDWGAAATALQRAHELDPANPHAAINLGLALAEAGDDARAEQMLAAAASSFPQLPAARHALGWALHRQRRAGEAIGHLQAAVASGGDPRWRLDLAKALADAGHADDAGEEFARVVEAMPRDPAPLTHYGRFCVGRGDFDRAAELFRAAAAAAPGDADLPMYLAQVELLRGRWREGWRSYARRHGEPRGLPARRELTGKLVVITSEQGLGDELFFLRFAPALQALGARLAYSGDARLAALLARTGLFERILAPGEPSPAGAIAILTGDLPRLLESEDTPPSLAIPPDPSRLEAMRARLERAGPRPWVGVTWRAGTPRHVVSDALHKQAPIAGLFAAMPRAGTVLSLQREGRFDELDAASRAVERPIHDFSWTAVDLEDALALAALLDRHVGVSNTNMHLAAAAGATADVLVPFPPEWRWGIEGDSPWFPGFRVYRQARDGDWSRAYAELASASAGSRSRA